MKTFLQRSWTTVRSMSFVRREKDESEQRLHFQIKPRTTPRATNESPPPSASRNESDDAEITGQEEFSLDDGMEALAQ